MSRGRATINQTFFAGEPVPYNFPGQNESSSYSPNNLSIRPALGVRGEEILDDGAGECGGYSLRRRRSKGFEGGGGRGAATRDEPLRTSAWEDGEWRLNIADRKAVSFVSLSSFSLLSSFPTKTPNTQATVPSSS